MTTAWFSVSHSVGCIGGLTMASITTYPSGEGQNMELLPSTYTVNHNDDICLAVSPHLAGQATDSHSNGEF